MLRRDFIFKTLIQLNKGLVTSDRCKVVTPQRMHLDLTMSNLTVITLI